MPDDFAAATCTSNAAETCYRDPSCLSLGDDTFVGLVCNAAGYEECRFCGFGSGVESITCPMSAT